MSSIAFYPNTFSKDFSVTSPESVIEKIISGHWADQIQYLQSLNKAEYDAEKKKLPAVTWGGTFKPGTRSIESIESYSQLVVIDIDKLDETMVPVLKNQMGDDEYVRYCFTSPSGKGIKVIILCNTQSRDHRAAFLHIQDYLEKKYLVRIDPSGKDVSRLCYISFDPKAIINPNSRVFEVDVKYGAVVFENRQTLGSFKNMSDAQRVFEVCKKWIGKKFTYVEGQRNVYLHALACALNRCGIRQQDTVNLIYANFQVPDDKWIQSVKSAYFHNQAEHGTYEVKDLGVYEFEAPTYISHYHDNVALNDIMTITSLLYSYNVPALDIINIVRKVAAFYDSQGYIDQRKDNVTGLMNQAITQLQTNIADAASKNALDYVVADSMIMDFLDYGVNENAISTGLPDFDDAMFGGMVPGNVYGAIGMGESFKSLLGQYICFVNACKGIPSLYLNSEMSGIQFYERLIYMIFGIDVREALVTGNINKETVDDFIRQITLMTGGNMFVVNSSAFTKQSVLSTIDLIRVRNGKKVKLLVSDGLTQWAWTTKEEISSTINSSMTAKEVAKEAHSGEGIAHFVLIHISGAIKRWYRDTGGYVRGGQKVLANLDAYFCTSRLIDPATNDLVNEDDIKYIPGKFYLRYVDKRSKTGIVNRIVNVGGNLKMEVEVCDPNVYEFKIKKNQN